MVILNKITTQLSSLQKNLEKMWFKLTQKMFVLWEEAVGASRGSQLDKWLASLFWEPGLISLTNKIIYENDKQPLRYF